MFLNELAVNFYQFFLKQDMNVSWCVDLRAFGTKLASPSTSCLREALSDRRCLLLARDAGREDTFYEAFVGVMTKERENVYKSRPRCKKHPTDSKRNMGPMTYKKI